MRLRFFFIELFNQKNLLYDAVVYWYVSSIASFYDVDVIVSICPLFFLRLVYDRETGKPKGYGFCEYQDQETALSAMRNLNGREFSGRALRVDNAASEKNKEELKSKLLH